MEERCSCNADYYTFIENPINIQLKKGKEPTVFKSTTKEPVKESYTRAISFKGCICELDKISENYSNKRCFNTKHNITGAHQNLTKKLEKDAWVNYVQKDILNGILIGKRCEMVIEI